MNQHIVEPTSVFIPSANDAIAAIIKIIRVKSCQASQRNLCRKKQTNELHQRKIVPSQSNCYK